MALNVKNYIEIQATTQRMGRGEGIHPSMSPRKSARITGQWWVVVGRHSSFRRTDRVVFKMFK